MAEMMPGCWIDGGLRTVKEGDEAVICLVEEYTGKEAADKIRAKGGQGEFSQEIADEAAEALAHLIPEGHWLGWDEGDFGVWAIEEE